MRRTVRKTGLIITSAAAGLAALSQCNAGLLGDLFDKHTDKDRDEIEKRMPACDCSFGYFATAWQPWGTCDQNCGAGCSSGSFRNSAPTILRGFQPGYSSGQSSDTSQSYPDTRMPPSSSVSPAQPEVIHSLPDSNGSSPSPILMTPVNPKPGPEDSSPSAQPPSISHPFAAPQPPPAANPFPRAVKTNPELPSPNSNPGLVTPAPNTSAPRAPLPQLTPGASVPLDPPSPSTGLSAPATKLPQPITQPAPNIGSQGTGITLLPRRATSVTIDVPHGSAGTTLSLPDPVRSGSTLGGAVGSPSPETETPEATPKPAGAPLRPLTPEPSLRPQPPTPVPSVIPGPAATFRMPAYQAVPWQMIPRQAVPQFSPVQHANAQPVIRQYSTVPQQPQLQPGQQFLPATHWQAVPQQQPQQQRNWRVMPGAYIQQRGSQQSGIQQLPQVQQQRLQPTPSERVIFLPPPPRR